MYKKTINFMLFSKAALAFSIFLMIASIASIAIKGINFGLDFTGGTVIELQYDSDADVEKVKQQLAQEGFDNSVVQHFGNAQNVLIRLQTDNIDAARDLVALLQKNNIEQKITVNKIDFIGAQVGEELRDQGGIAVLVSIVGILLYLAVRFQYKFGIGALSSLIHDVVVSVGVVSFLQIPFDLTVLAAIFALIGYSLNDTIVVYDRIRENFHYLQDKTLVNNINISLTQTLMRTISTSFSTMLALFALLFFGGEALYGFAFILCIGIVIGTYSSIYIATYALISIDLNILDIMPPKDNDDEDLV